MKIQPFAAALLLFGVSTPSARAQLSISWLTQYGSSFEDRGQAITVDALGQSWVSGSTYGDLGGPNAGLGVDDLFLSRLSASGSVDFTQQRGGTGPEPGSGVALVGSGTVFAGGSTGSPIIDGQTSLGDSDALAIRFGSDGTWQGTTRFGSGTTDVISALAGNATSLLAAGTSYGGFDGHSSAGQSDAFLTKRDGTGAVIWTRWAGTNGYEFGEGGTYDGAGNGYLAGGTGGSLSGFTNEGAYDLFVIRYDPAGNQTLLLQLGTDAYESATDVAVDVSGNIYLTGHTYGALGGESNAGNQDGFVMKLDSNGSVLWTRLLGGSGYDESVAIGLDGAGHVWIGGSSYSTFAGHTNAGSADAFVAEYDSDGLLLGTMFLATSGDDALSGLSIGPDGSAYVTGLTTGALGGPNAGNYDVFVAKVVPEPSTALLLGGAGLGLLLRRRRA